MSIERLRIADNGLLEVHGKGDMCWYQDYEDMVRSMQAEMDRMTDRLMALSKGETVRVEYDLSPAMHESAVRSKLIELGWTPPSSS